MAGNFLQCLVVGLVCFSGALALRRIREGETLRLVVGEGSLPLDSSTNYVASILCDAQLLVEPDVALSWSVRSDKTVVRNSKKTGAWGANETFGGQTHPSIGEAFTLDFTLTAEKWEVVLDGVRRFDLDYVHRTSCTMSSAVVTSNMNAWISVLDPAPVAMRVATTETKTKDSGAESSDGGMMYFGIFAALLVTLAVIGGMQYFARQLARSAKDNVGPSPSTVEEEWFYSTHQGAEVFHGDVEGPVSRKIMRRLMDSGEITFDTRVKLAQDINYLKVSEVFPEGGAFLHPPRLSEQQEQRRQSAAPEAMMWFYRTPGDDVQGPITTSEMHRLYTTNHFSEHVRIRLDDAEGQFFPIRTYFPNPEVAFKTYPVASAEQARHRDLRVWCVQAPNGEIHGPFEDAHMREWFNADHINPATLIRKGEITAQGEFATVQNWYPDLERAFTTRPVDPFANRHEEFESTDEGGTRLVVEQGIAVTPSTRRRDDGLSRMDSRYSMNTDYTDYAEEDYAAGAQQAYEDLSEDEEAVEAQGPTDASQAEGTQVAGPKAAKTKGKAKSKVKSKAKAKGKSQSDNEQPGHDDADEDAEDVGAVHSQMHEL